MKFHTTYCNRVHDLDSGAPIGHECYVLPPAALRDEYEGNFDAANNVLASWSRGEGHTIHPGLPDEETES
jgi:hypothetical protein